MNKDVLANDDAVVVLAYSLVLLNTDQHNENAKTKMNVDDFCKNLRGVNGGADFDRDMLMAMYNSIK